MTIWMSTILTGALSLVVPIVYLATSDITFLYYSTFTRISAVLTGMCAGLIFRAGNPAGRWIRTLMQKNVPLRLLFSCGSLALAILLLCGADGKSAWIYLGGMTLVDFWCALLILTAAAGALNQGFLELQVMKGIGRMGFDLYLWQYPTIFILNHLLGEALWVKALEVTVTVLLAVWGREFTGKTVESLRKISRAGHSLKGAALTDRSSFGKAGQAYKRRIV